MLFPLVLLAFFGGSSVNLANGNTRAMRDIRVGDVVLDEHRKPTPVIAWIQRDPEHRFQAYRMGDAFASPDVLVQLVNRTFVRVGDLPLDHTKTLWVNGAYAPMTESGTIVLDNKRFSCYTEIRAQSFMHKWFTLMYKTGQLLYRDSGVRQPNEQPGWIRDVVERLFG